MANQWRIETVKGGIQGTLLECLVWQAEYQGAFPSLIDAAGLTYDCPDVADAKDPHRGPDQITPEKALDLVIRQIVGG